MIDSGAAAVGRRLEALKLDELGVDVTALRRRGVRNASPSPEMRLDVDDVLILAGTPEALAKAEMRLLQG